MQKTSKNKFLKKQGLFRGFLLFFQLKNKILKIENIVSYIIFYKESESGIRFEEKWFWNFGPLKDELFFRCNQCWPKDIRYSLSSDIRIKMVVIFILSFFYSEWSNNHLIFILSFHFLGIILFEKIRITSNNHSFFKMGKNVISWLLFPSIFLRESLV